MSRPLVVFELDWTDPSRDANSAYMYFCMCQILLDLTGLPRKIAKDGRATAF